MKRRSGRRIVLAATAAALAVAGFALPSGSASAATGPDVAMVRAHTAGGVTSAEAGDQITFVFSAQNNGPGGADLAITLIWAHGIDRNMPTSRLSCVLPNGSVFEPDGDSCEPGFVRPGQRPSSLVFTGVATGQDIDVKACASNLTVSVDPLPRNNCRTVRVDLPDPLIDVTHGLVIPPEKTHVNLFVEVACKAPANGTAYLSSVIWQGTYPNPDYVQGQGLTQVVCDGVKRSYSFEAVRDDPFAPRTFKAGPAMAESNVSYCVQLDPDNAVCYGLGNLVRQSTHFRRL
ncbi:MAG: hypothetical protein ACJ71T_08635 [Actinomycetales bacterium]